VRGTLTFVSLVYLLMLFLRPQEFYPSMVNSPILQVTLLSAFAIWLFCGDKRATEPHFLLLPPLFIIACIGMGLSGWWGGAVKVFDLLAPPFLMFIILTGAIRTLGQQRFVQWGIIAAACVMVLHGHWQLITGIGWMGTKPIEGRITYSGIFNDPNDLGLLIVFAVSSSLYLRGVTRNFLLRTALLAALGWLLYGVYLTNSRGTLLASLVVIGAFAWRRYGKVLVITAGAIAVPVLIAFTRLSEVDADEASAEGRIDAWYEGLQMLISYPIFGVGFSNFSDHHHLTAHNSVVLAMAELGLAGFMFWLAFVALAGWSVWTLLRRGTAAVPAGVTPEAARAELEGLTALLIGGLGFAVGAFFLSQAYKPMLFIIAGLLVGRYFGAQAVLGPMQSPGFGTILGKAAVGSVAWVIFLYIALKFLL
jgi:putative inorganic carbon (hco3(-)) transporter